VSDQRDAYVDFATLVASRRMVRAFRSDPVERGLLHSLVDTARRSPSAGNTQGWHCVVLEGGGTEIFWASTLAVEKRATFRWKHLLDAPVIMLSFADPNAYLQRYSETDKASTGLGVSTDAWPAPYWTIDASFATMTLLLAAHEAGLGALFFGVFSGESQLRAALDVPPHLQLIGAIALGYARTMQPDEDPAAFRPGASAARKRASATEILHFGRW